MMESDEEEDCEEFPVEINKQAHLFTNLLARDSSEVVSVLDPDSGAFWIRIRRINNNLLIARRDKISVVDPDPYWIRIQELPGSVFRIRIRVPISNSRIKWRQNM